MKKREKQKRENKTKMEGNAGLEGFYDVLPKQENYWNYFCDTGKAVSKLHDFRFINTVLLEKRELYEKAWSGEEKEKLKQLWEVKIGKNKVVLRYSFRESILRSYLDNKLAYFSSPLKVFYIGKLFRNIETDEYFYRSFHQFGFQILGESDVFYDGEVIIAIYDFLRKLKLNNLVLKLGNAGCKNCHYIYKRKLQNYFLDKTKILCNSCRKFFPDEVFKLLEKRCEKCSNLRESAPSVLNSLCSGCNNHMKSLVEIVEDNEIPYEIDEHLTGSGDSENKTIFEFYVPEISYSLAFGSRYDYLAEKLFNKHIPAVGGNIGVERTIQAMIKQKVDVKLKDKPKVSFLVIGNQAKSGALKLMNKLRLSGIGVVEFANKKSLESQIKMAERMGIKIGVIIGQKEVFDGTAILRDIASGMQEVVLTNKLIEEIKKRLSN